MNLIWRPDACHDLRRIQDDVGDCNLSAAGDLLDLVSFYAERLSDNPEIFGSDKQEDIGKLLVHPNYALIYKVRPDMVEIVNVVHARRQHPPAKAL